MMIIKHGGPEKSSLTVAVCWAVRLSMRGVLLMPDASMDVIMTDLSLYITVLAPEKTTNGKNILQGFSRSGPR